VLREFVAAASLSLLLVPTSCAKGPHVAQGRDEILFDRGNQALNRGQTDFAMIELVTLINTYPSSAYAANSKSLIENDPRLSCHTARDLTFTFGSLKPCPLTGRSTGKGTASAVQNNSQSGSKL
jgi:hypothetical protein